jgi:hypothetical protein
MPPPLHHVHSRVGCYEVHGLLLLAQAHAPTRPCAPRPAVLLLPPLSPAALCGGLLQP